MEDQSARKNAPMTTAYLLSTQQPLYFLKA